MKITTELNIGTTPVTVEMDATQDKPSSELEDRLQRGRRLSHVTLNVFMGEGGAQIYTAHGQAKTIAEAAEVVVADFQKWLGSLAQIHDTAVRMRRMLEREEGGK